MLTMAHHLTEKGTFKSDKYAWCPEGFFALKFTDKNAQEAILRYAELATDRELAEDLRAAVEKIRKEQ